MLGSPLQVYFCRLHNQPFRRGEITPMPSWVLGKPSSNPEKHTNRSLREWSSTASPTPITRQSTPCPQVFESLMQFLNLWPCGAINFNIYRIVTGIFWEILQIATFGDPIPCKKGVVGLSSNYPLFLDIWSERLDLNQRLPAPKKSTLFIIITDT